MNRKKILESWKKYRLKKEIKNLERYVNPPNFGDEDRLVIDTSKGRERRTPFRSADVRTEYLKRATRGARMENMPLSSDSSPEKIRQGFMNYLNNQEIAWSQTDIPERRADRLRKAKALLRNLKR